MSFLGAKLLLLLNKCYPQKYYVKILEICGYVSNLKIYADTHPIDTEHSMAFIDAGRLNQKVWDKGHAAYKDGYGIF
jgi:hypothetical protein